MRVGVLGLGFMGSMHIRAWRQVDGATLTAVYSSDPRKLQGDLSSIQGNLGAPGEKYDFSSVHRFSSIDELLADPGVDAVDICLPTDLHAPVALKALEAGKDVLVEKPLALTGEEAEDLVKEARARRRILMTAQVLRFFPAYVALRDALQSGRWGPVRAASFRRRCAAPVWNEWLKDPRRSGGGVFDLLIHDVDFALHLFGRPQALSAVGYEDLERGIDVITATLHFDSVPVVIAGGWHHRKSFPFSMDYTVVTEAATFEYSSLSDSAIQYGASGETEPMPLSKDDAFAAELRYFARCVRERRWPELCPPEESAAAVKLARAMAEARSRPGEKLPWS